MNIASIARPYAKAVYLLTNRDANKIEIQEHWLLLFNNLSMIVETIEIRNLAKNSSLNKRKFTELLMAWVKKVTFIEINYITLNRLQRFIELLLSRKKLSLFPEIAKQFLLLKNNSLGIAQATIFSAFPVKLKQLNCLLPILEKKFAVHLAQMKENDIHLEPNLLGGIKVMVGDNVLDYSLRAKLNKMRSAISST